MYHILIQTIMAIVKSLGLGKARGSAGEFTYSTIQGRTIARTKPAHVHNPNTVPQRAQRLKMKNVVIAWRDVGQRLEKLWTKRKKYNSAYNSFVSANIANDKTFEMAPTGTEVYLKDGFVLGQGQYNANLLGLQITADSATIEISKSESLHPNLKIGDVLGMVFLGDFGQIVEIEERVIDEYDFQEGTPSFKTTFTTDRDDITGHAPYWYSPSRNLSTDCVVTLVP